MNATIILTGIWAALLGLVIALPQLLSLPDRGEFLIRNTVRIALLYWAIAVALKISLTYRTLARFTWTLACVTYLIHVGTAFKHAHHWSHEEAFEHVKQAGGVGEGIFVSYAFTALWTIDAAWWWLDRTAYEQRSCWIDRCIHGFMAFVIVNATMIFESGPIRWIGAAVLIGLGWTWWRISSSTPSTP